MRGAKLNWGRQHKARERKEEAWLCDWYYYCPSATDLNLAVVKEKLQTGIGKMLSGTEWPTVYPCPISYIRFGHV